jgi:2-dehydropantoate 2-reductase
MRTVIVGAGALGTLIAARLHHHGSNVTLIERDAARRARVEHGIQVRGFRRIDAQLPLKVAAPEAIPTDADAIVLCTPARTLEATVEGLAAALPSHPPLLVLAGGLTPLRIEHAWPAETILGVTNLEVRLDQDGNPETGFHNFTWLGNRVASETEAMRALQHELAWLAPTLTTKAIVGMVWSKALFSIEAALPVLAGESPSTFYAADRHLDLAADLSREGIAVASDHGSMPIAFDFFDPNLLLADTPGEIATRRAWMRHCWIRHEQFRVGAPVGFHEPAGIGALLSRDHRDGELALIVEQLRQAAAAVGRAVPRLDALAALIAGGLAGAAAIARLEAAAP